MCRKVRTAKSLKKNFGMVDALVFCSGAQSAQQVEVTMRVRYKQSSVNQYSPHAEREVTLTEIDSMLHNGEINMDEAKEMAIRWAAKTNNTQILLQLFPVG
jgi:hypothetical protein